MWLLLRRYPIVLLFGMFQIVYSAPGQTFIVSLFILSFQESLAVSHTLIAMTYSIATLLASLLLTPIGRSIDRLGPQVLLKWVFLGMALGCVCIGTMQQWWVLGVGFFLIRLFGQGVFGILGSTVIAKAFQRNRGRAQGLITLGYPLSEILYPSLTLLLMSLVGWRWTYLCFALSCVVVIWPVQTFLLKRSGVSEGQFLEGEATHHSEDGYEQSCSLSHVVRDPAFYMVVTASSLSPVVITALLYHQETLFASHGWDIAWVAYGLAFYACMKALGSVLMGPIVDRYSTLILFVLMVLFLAVGTFVAGMGGGIWMMFLYLGLIGWALGTSSPIMTMVWTRLYGVSFIGGIKGMVSMIRNGVTALGPLPLAVALDYGWPVQWVLYCVAVFVLVLTVLPVIVHQRYSRLHVQSSVSLG